ncbi:MAG TPA: D-alanine--D-alanine ligase [Blastocatellia bacterium]|nr:D-alanine--D-alanine ligase [Blastocatellia bacterium]HMV83376.1 D-alanine--D-alanine ligase [Blastocatellia bacterium]HMX24241.1 D-alanine--D-alanine ligase [Blastocatellia bacterium]HMY71691.1 D-alanine--D-alanine ligase [Blastocatellia bacterium]HMZ18420.1 D-alanine--D-alanine ligase [Blastocatellia bacterium]
MSQKLRVGVIFGGRSGEHEVSLRSAESIINALDRDKYEVVPIAITSQGKWLASSEATILLPSAVIENADQHVAIFGDPTEKGLARLGAGKADERDKLDVIFPVLHGTYGEDGTIQGLLEMADVPYVGCGVLGSAAGMDKVVMKRLFREAGLPIVEFTHFLRTQWEADPLLVEARVAEAIGFPCFVKPANLGSSVGISKATDAKSLNAAIQLAARYDRKIVVERGVDAREIEVSVLGNDHPVASLPGEIVPQSADFYDYQAKYIHANGARLMIPAELSDEQTAEIQRLAVEAFQAIDGAGLGRVDFFLERETGKLLLNEINTMPGFTSISMYPKLWEASGIGYKDLIDRLIELAFDRHREKSRNLTHYA